MSSSLKNSAVTDSFGFKNNEIQVKRELEKKYRVCFLGDIQTQLHFSIRNQQMFKIFDTQKCMTFLILVKKIFLNLSLKFVCVKNFKRLLIYLLKCLELNSIFKPKLNFGFGFELQIFYYSYKF